MRSAHEGARRLTPPGPGAVAVLEVAGPDAAQRLARIGLTRLPGPGEIRLVRPRAEGGLLDEALLVRTGEACFELHVHASPPLVEELCERLGGSERAPTVAVEELALELASEAASELGARVLLAQADGALRRAVAALRTAPLGAERELLGRAEPLARLVAPVRVVLVGAVNAGKSTLFNALVGETRATVSAHAGTTRDALTARAAFGPYPVELVDTAGARELAHAAGLAADVEREGQALARWLVERADLVLHLVPAGESVPPLATGAAPLVLVRTKGDLGPRPSPLRGRDPDAPDVGGGGTAIAALRDAAGAARWVADAALAALGLPGDPFPDPSVGAPFTPALEAGLRAAFELPPGSARDRALEVCLLRTPRVDPGAGGR